MRARGDAKKLILLAQLICERPDEIRADLMETYGICLEEAMEGSYSAPFVASLCEQLPSDCRWRASYEPDAWWTGDRLLLAALVNALNGLVWGMSDRKRRGARPRLIGPKWATRRGRSVPTLAFSKERLMELLSRPRRKAGDR